MKRRRAKINPQKVEPSKQRGRVLRAVAKGLKWATVSAATVGFMGLLGLSARVAYNNSRKLNELRASGVPIASFVDYNRAGMCSGYAKDIALQVSKKVYNFGANAWELPKMTKVTFWANFDRQKKSGGISKSKLTELIKEGKITPGTLIGCFNTESSYNSLDRPFTHALVFVGGERFAQNLNGPSMLSINELYSKGTLFPICTMEPK